MTADDVGTNLVLPADCAPEIEDLTRVLRELVTQSRRILGFNYVGAYLQGSVAQGAADLESDCDFLVVIQRPLTTTAFSDLAALHASLPRRPGHWSGHLEGSYPVAAELAALGGLEARWAYVDHGSAILERDSAHCNTPVARRILRECGIALDGPAAKTLVEPIGPYPLWWTQGLASLFHAATWIGCDGARGVSAGAWGSLVVPWAK